MIKGCADSGIVGILEKNTILVISSIRTACSIDSGIFVQVCSIGDRNSRAFIQIWYTGLDIINAQFEGGLRIVRVKCIVIDHLWSTAIAICDFHRIQFVKGNAVRQSISEANSVLFIVIVSTAIVFACGQLSDQPELERFVDCMVSGTTPTTSRANVVVVVDFLLNSGLYNLMIN